MVEWYYIATHTNVHDTTPVCIQAQIYTYINVNATAAWGCLLLFIVCCNVTQICVCVCVCYLLPLQDLQ